MITFYLNFRAQSVGGGVAGPSAWQGNGDVANPALLPLDSAALRGLVAGRDVIFAVHGFATDQIYGTRMFARLNAYLAPKLPASAVFFGVLWPGDSWLPFVDYPFEGSFAMETGARLARYVNTWMRAATSVSFLSHSLGARVVLQAVPGLATRAKLLCLTAAAVNQRCLAEEYAADIDKAGAITALASHKDHVLEIAYPPGDIVADTLIHDHPYLEPALGYSGPPGDMRPQPIPAPWLIPDTDGYDHSDYHVPGDGAAATLDAAGNPRWIAVADFFLRAWRDQPQTWP